MKEWIIAAALFVGAGVSIGWAADAPAKSPQQIVDERVAGMKKMGGAVKGASDSKADPAAAIDS